jgi:hypothetical protein
MEKTGICRSHEYRSSQIRTDAMDFVIARYSTFK